MKKPIYAVFDVGKTNKKVILFDEARQIIDEHQQVCLETVDEDGFACETLSRLSHWVLDRWQALRQNAHYNLKGVNFTSYGASFVHLGANGQPILPLYNYLKPLPTPVQEAFYAELESEPTEFAAETCSPQMGMLNSGMQLYWLKHTQPEQFSRIRTSLHLPQYLSYLITGEAFSDYTSVGCHTGLWDFRLGRYHDWVYREGIDEKLAPLTKDSVASVVDGILVGVGLHDSSAALLPYRQEGGQSFLLVSTGTWAVTLNPFNREPLTPELLRRDCLSYLSPKGEMTKAARVFFGREHDFQVQRIADHFHVKPDFYHSLMVARPYDAASDSFRPWCMKGTGPYPDQPVVEWDLSNFSTAADAYQHLMHGLMSILTESINLVRRDEKLIYVDGGFARNPLFMQLLSQNFPDAKIRTLEVPQATALGALIHLEQGEAWKKTQLLFS
ncbi:FGGY family carbohydrate kinase [Hymenobacter aerilatus]|uniref:FGGY family carbohydrate kinase n=1 Tax=Hymenobacter aerilatus TaxID=2932251 RepID=A0A8T9SVQ3_9BACT|nr:FGGY family carbohydrate kinase [Hymenobacter aerilatus]UOR06148.1 FGGY family carbohydrate kinase [Hymenobacter aerilatus]